MKTRCSKMGAILLSALIVGALGLQGMAYAITNGTPDGDAHPYVCLVVFDVGGVPAWRTTGVLISPTIVLTAGHGTDGTDAARVWFLADVTYDSVPFPLYPYGGPGSGAIEGTPVTNPDYGHYVSGKGLGIPNFSYHDVGVVVLDEPVYMDEYGELPEAGLVDTLMVQSDVDLVGYGVSVQVRGGGVSPRDAWTGPRIRMYAPAKTLSGSFSWSDEFLRCTANPGNGKGGTAFGDSGGPVFLAGTNKILALNSYVTNANCGGVTYHQRIDIPNILAWINGFLE